MMRDAPAIVSVCIPTVNRLDYFREALRSAVAQTVGGLEIVVADNSGDARYQAEVRAVLVEHPDACIRLHQHRSRLTMVDNANYLVDVAAGRYWMYLPDDDRLRPNCLARLMAPLERDASIGVSWCDHWVIDAGGRTDEQASASSSIRFGRTHLRGGSYENHDLLTLALRQSFAIQCMLFRREVILEHRFDPAFESVLDFDLELRLAADASTRAFYVADRLVDYRVHGQQFTGRPARAANSRLMIAALERSRPSTAEQRRLRAHMLSRYHRSLAAEGIASMDRGGALRHALRAVTLKPLSDAWALIALSLLPARLAHAIADSLRPRKGTGAA